MPAPISFRSEIDALIETGAPMNENQATPVVTNTQALFERVADKCDELKDLFNISEYLGPIRELSLIGENAYDLEDIRTRLDIIITTLKSMGKFPTLGDVMPIGDAEYEIKDLKDRLDVILIALKSV